MGPGPGKGPLIQPLGPLTPGTGPLTIGTGPGIGGPPRTWKLLKKKKRVFNFLSPAYVNDIYCNTLVTSLTVTTLWANSADNKLMIFFLENRI